MTIVSVSLEVFFEVLVRFTIFPFKLIDHVERLQNRHDYLLVWQALIGHRAQPRMKVNESVVVDEDVVRSGISQRLVNLREQFEAAERRLALLICLVIGVERICHLVAELLNNQFNMLIPDVLRVLLLAALRRDLSFHIVLELFLFLLLLSICE